MDSKKGKKVKVFQKKKKCPEKKIIEDLQAQYDAIDATKSEKFSDLPLSSQTKRGLKENEFITLTDIQKQSIGLALRGFDILGAAKTGSGKTLAFLIPVIELLYCKQWTRLDGVGALIITPTRELAYQIYETLRKVGCYHELSAGLIIGGKDLHFEKKRMHQCNIVICTPGRLLHHMDENPLFDCSNMQVLVLDEADRCLDMGFEKSMNAIVENLPESRQTLLFSATQTKSLRDLARLSLKDPMYVSAHEYSTHTTPEGLQQSYVVCELEDKMALLWSFVRNHLKQKIIVFFSTCKQAKFVCESFCRMRPGVSLLALYGSLHQLRRMKIYESFCKKQHAVLFSTDIASRGLDFPEVNWVIQMDCPEDVNAYIHRAGRTARFQSGGESLLVLLPSETKIVDQLLDRKIPISMIKINPNKFQSPHRKLEALLARDNELKETAKRAFSTYIKSVFLKRDKSIFDVNALNTDAFAESLGLTIPPKIRFLQKIAGSSTQGSKPKQKTETKRIDKVMQIEKEVFDNEGSSSKKISDTDVFGNEESEGDDDDDDEILTIKRKNVQIDDLIDEPKEIDVTKSKDKKVVTKAALAKKILKKKIVPNKKINFDEEGQEIFDSAKSKQSEHGKKYDQEIESGINIEVAKETLRLEDKFDKERFKLKIKEKHREMKRKLKAAKTEREDSEEGEDLEEGEDSEEREYSEEEGSEKGSEEEPDSEEEDSEVEESESDKISEDEAPKLNKRKLVISKDYQKSKKKRLESASSSKLGADEELALKLLGQ